MKPETVGQLVDVLENLMNECHELALKIAAAERIFQHQAPDLFDTYSKELEHLRPTFESSGALVISALRERLLHG
jgi:hypothetical protein